MANSIQFRNQHPPVRPVPLPDRPARPRPDPALLRLPPLPVVLVKLLGALGNEKASFAEISNLIRSDVALTAQVLRLANSALFSVQCPITGVLQATSLIGLSRIRGMAITLAFQNYLKPALDSAMLRRVWRHSLATALVSEHLAREGPVDRDEAFTMGLLHKIGLMALVVAYPNEWNRPGWDDEVRAAGLLEWEREVLGADHLEFGRRLQTAWRLPPLLLRVLSEVPVRYDQFTVPVLVDAACQIAGQMGFWIQEPAQAIAVETLVQAIPEWKRFATPTRFDAWPAEVATAINSIELSALG
jgi:HD-like signal output (HDOD) protein